MFGRVGGKLVHGEREVLRFLRSEHHEIPVDPGTRGERREFGAHDLADLQTREV